MLSIPPLAYPTPLSSTIPLFQSPTSYSDPTNFPEQRSKVFSNCLSEGIDPQLQAMEEHETEVDVPCLVCYDLRLSTYSFNEPDRFERQRKLARELSGYDPFDRHRRLFVEPHSLNATAAAGCLSCVLLKDVWGRLCHTVQLCVGEDDMKGRHGFFLYPLRGNRSDLSTSRVLHLYSKDHVHVIHTMEGTVAVYSHAGARNRLKTNDKTNSRRALPLGYNNLSTLEWPTTVVGSSAAVCRRCIRSAAVLHAGRT